MRKTITFLLLFTLCLCAPKVEGMERDSAPLDYQKNVKSLNYQKNIKSLYKEDSKNVIAVFDNKKTYYISSEEVYLMAQVVYGESRGEPYDGKVAVASVILNRVVSGKFPDTVEGVVKQKNAFSCLSNGKITVKPDKASYNAVLDALKGKDPTSKAIFFYNPKTATCSWMKSINKVNIKSIGNHIFFAVK
ncbi:cell wall hydrolase [Haloimpatiens sp. FM7315]|uniref:cell wall hydrolase n=1 Tax=Haloimpatiens sp. FM7315 TaxID=3298609 RepID=UPI00370A70A0